MPVLDWIGKKAVINHHCSVPYRLIHCDKDKSVGDPDSGNLLVQGDNLEALKALLPYYAGKVKCIYIDPPYNTGEQTWVYNDNVNSNEIKIWLGKTVGKETEDLSRHDKWLCMMYPRLRLLKDFLDFDGVIFVSIDDEEVTSLRIIMNEIFGKEKFIGQFVWKSRQNKDNRNITGASIDHEYVLTYGKSLRGDGRKEDQFKNPDNDPRGPWSSGNMVGIATKENRPNLHYNLIHPTTGINYGCPKMGWRFDKKRMQSMIAENRILWPLNIEGRPRQKVFLNEFTNQYTGFSSIIGEGLFTKNGSKEIDEIFEERIFPFAKPNELIRSLIQQGCPNDGIIMDTFAGSGTTGQAVLDQSNSDGIKRNFILVEMDNFIAENITHKRLKKAAEINISGFRYCTLGEPLFDAEGHINPRVKFSSLAAHIYFCETGSPIPRRASTGSPLIGLFQGRAIYLLHDAEMMGVPSRRAGNVLTLGRIKTLPLPDKQFKGPRIVYAEGCTVPDDRLASLGVTFKHIPYQIAGV
jgi:adenine-specific DNA-methyltransferase